MICVTNNACATLMNIQGGDNTSTIYQGENIMAVRKIAEFAAASISADRLADVIALIPNNSAYSLTQNPVREDAEVATNVTLIMSNVSVENLSGIVAAWTDALGGDNVITVK